jgi:hypothetical protein
VDTEGREGGWGFLGVSMVIGTWNLDFDTAAEVACDDDDDDNDDAVTPHIFGLVHSKSLSYCVAIKKLKICQFEILFRLDVLRVIIEDTASNTTHFRD